MSEAIDRILDLGFLGAITNEDLKSLRPAPEVVHVKTGETLIWEGEPGDAYFLLLRGRLRRFVADERGGRRFVGDVFPGQGVGASGLLTLEGNASTVRVMHDSEVVRFSRAAFLQMMVLSWEFAISVSREQIERVRAAVAPRGRHPSIKAIAVVPIDATVDAQGFVDDLATAVAGMASVTTVGEDSIDLPTGTRAATSKTAGPSGDAEADAVASRLDAFERKFDVVLYRVSAVADAWTWLILARADLVLLVAAAGGNVDLCGTEQVLIGPTEDELLPRIDLVVMHGQDWDPACRTRNWLDIRHIEEWHHLRRGRQEDYARLARVLTGNAITLVLGGGGARGLAEIGVYRALREAGIPIDRIGGTSMGALLAALLVSAKDQDDIDRRLRIWVKKGGMARDYTLPALSIIRGSKLHRATHELLGDGNIEDLPISFFCVSSDLSESKGVIHDRGSLWRSVRASISLPAIGPPLFDSGRILVDGAMVSNVPADVAARRYTGRIIAVDVSLPRKRVVPESYYDFVPSGWKILWHRINPFLTALDVPGIHEIVARSILMGSYDSYRKAREVSDMYIQPPVSGAGLLDFHAMDELIAIGYQHAIKQLASVGKPALQQLFPGLEILHPSTPHGAESSPPIDRVQFNEILGVDDDNTFREMVGFFIAMFPAEIDQLAAAASGGESGAIRERAHRAKSAAVNVAAPALTAILQNIERKARAGEVEGLPDLVDRVRTEFRRIETYTRRS